MYISFEKRGREGFISRWSSPGVGYLEDQNYRYKKMKVFRVDY